MKETIMEPAYSPFLAVEKGNMCLRDASGLDRVVTIKELAHSTRYQRSTRPGGQLAPATSLGPAKVVSPHDFSVPCVFVNGFVSCPQF
jgi:hypothetical protein